jgi:hypothetical protein
MAERNLQDFVEATFWISEDIENELKSDQGERSKTVEAIIAYIDHSRGFATGMVSLSSHYEALKELAYVNDDGDVVVDTNDLADASLPSAYIDLDNVTDGLEQIAPGDRVKMEVNVWDYEGESYIAGRNVRRVSPEEISSDNPGSLEPEDVGTQKKASASA